MTENASNPHYPELSVSVSSANPLVLVSAVRYALWQAGVSHEQIGRFSRQALDQASEREQREICAHWVTVSSQMS